MSLSIEIRVNGHPVALVVATNVGPALGSAPVGTCRYKGHLTHFKPNGQVDTAHLAVLHERDAGILALASKLLGEIT